MAWKVKHKFNAIQSEADGIKFASKKERRRYLELTKKQACGDIAFFLNQVPIRLSGGVKYICDFLVFWTSGEVTFEDVKGYRTELYKTKKKMVEATYPIKITEI